MFNCLLSRENSISSLKLMSLFPLCVDVVFMLLPPWLAFIWVLIILTRTMFYLFFINFSTQCSIPSLTLALPVRGVFSIFFIFFLPTYSFFIDFQFFVLFLSIFIRLVSSFWPSSGTYNGWFILFILVCLVN